VDICSVLSRALTRDDYAVDCAYSLSEANGKLDEHPSVILLDNNMPDGSGLEYLQMHPVQFMGTFVIMITADTSPVLEQKAKEEGVEAFVKKPFSIHNVWELIRQSA